MKHRWSGARAELLERLDAVTGAHRDAVEVNEALVQGMVAAMWSLEYGRHEDGLRILRDTIRLGHHQVSRLMREAGMGPRGLRGNNVRQPDGEDDWDQAGQSA